MNEPSKPTPSGALAQALHITQEGMTAFQRLQEQTAQLHRQFLQNQEVAQQTLNRMIEQQQQLILSSLGVAAPVQTTPPPLAALPAPEPVTYQSPAKPQAAKVLPQPIAFAPAPSSERHRIQSILMEVIADKTGYPVEMLNPEMGLDADLGIDSIKRVEILSTVQEKLPDAPVVKSEHLGTLNTLAQIIDFIAGGAPRTFGPHDRLLRRAIALGTPRTCKNCSSTPWRKRRDTRRRCSISTWASTPT